MHTANPPRVSAIIPTRNRPELLRRAVLSVLQQTLREVEAVVVIDGPDPGTVEMLATIDDARLRVIALPHSVGGSDARNIGAQQATGEWVALLDDDDEWLAEKCATQLALVESLSKGEPLVVSSFIARTAAGEDRLLPLRPPQPQEPISEYMFAPHCGYQTSTFFCRREFLLRTPFTSGLQGCQDLDWFLRAASVDNVHLVIAAEPLAIFHVPQGRKSVSQAHSWRFRLTWGQSQRALMTRLGYSRFLVRVCAVRAREEGAGLRSYLTLFAEMLLRG